MTVTQEAVQAPATTGARRNEKVGQVVSTKMQKTIVVEVEMRKAHAKYKRIVRSTKKFYAHDEQSSARLGDVVRIRETRPLSKLKRARRRTHGSANENDARGGRQLWRAQAASDSAPGRRTGQEGRTWRRCDRGGEGSAAG